MSGIRSAMVSNMIRISARAEGSVRLDLSALEKRARAAAAVTGMPSEQLTITVMPTVTTRNGAPFVPELRLILTPLQLTLADDPNKLVVQDTATPAVTKVPRTRTLLHQKLSIAHSRMLATGLLLLAGLIALALWGFASRTAPMSEGAAIRRRYGPLLLAVHPMPTVPGRPAVEVTTFAALARLAERYGLLVLHWTRSDIDTFIVQDENTLYRYRAGGDASGRPEDRRGDAASPGTPAGTDECGLPQPSGEVTLAR